MGKDPDISRAMARQIPFEVAGVALLLEQCEPRHHVASTAYYDFAEGRGITMDSKISFWKRITAIVNMLSYPFIRCY